MTFEKPKSKCQQKIIPIEPENTIFPLKPIDTALLTDTDRNVTAKHVWLTANIEWHNL